MLEVFTRPEIHVNELGSNVENMSAKLSRGINKNNPSFTVYYCPFNQEEKQP